MRYQIHIYQTSAGKKPFDQWFSILKDTTANVLILERLDRIGLGNFGDTAYVGDGVWELRCHGGPGYRVYYGRRGSSCIILICGGTKRTQKNDIGLAKKYWLDFTKRVA